MQRLIDYSWPGNVRELANIVERAMIVCEGDTLETGDLALLDVTDVRDEQTTTFDEMARQHLLHTLDDCGGVIEGPHGAAARLGLKPATLRSRMKKLGLVRTGSSFGLSG
jgi:transcriptional regulator of acetoin/glycerol metabolism